MGGCVMGVHNHGIDPTCKERLVGECLLKPGVVVLNLDEVPAGAVIKALRGTLPFGQFSDVDLLEWVADQIEAQIKPPRIPEPGLYGVVSTEDHKGLTTYHWRSHDAWHAEDGHIREWGDLDNPTLVREGVQ